MAYEIRYAPDAERHVRSMSARQRRTIVDQIERQLQQQPTSETRNRKRMRPNELAPWELRVGNLRVYYDVDEDAAVVTIVAAGVKRRNEVLIEGRVFRL